MAKVKIVTDSSATMAPELIKEFGIHVIPLSVMVDGVVYIDDEKFTGPMFMDLMKNSKALPKTSQPPIGKFIELYDELGKDGSTIISIHMTESLSGTVNTARQAAQMSSSEVFVVDSLFVDQSMAFQVVAAAKAANKGENAETILKLIEEIQAHSRLFIGISTLDNLVKGGRVSRVAGVVSNIFNMKVIMEMIDTQLNVVVKGRGVRTFNKWFDGLVEELKSLTNLHSIGISYAGEPDLANAFCEKLQNIYPDKKVWVLHTNPIVATHTGPGAFAVMFYSN